MDRRGFLGLATGLILGRGTGSEQVKAPGGGRVTGTVTQYLANNAVYNVRDYGARADGGDDGPAIRRALDAAGPAGGTLLFPPGTYSYAESPNFARDDLEILGQGRATLRHTGRGVGFLADGWLRRPGRKVWNMRVENLAVEGNAETTIGFLFRSVHHGRFARLRVIGGAPEGEGFRTEFFVANYCESWGVTGNERVVGTLPGTGITLTSLAAPRQNYSTVDCTFMNCIVEACGHTGVRLDQAQNNMLRGGTFEDHRGGIGLVLEPGARGNVVDGVFLESNRVHIECRGPHNQFVALTALGGLSRFHSGADFTRVIGGQYADMAIVEGARDVKLLGVAARRISDHGMRTQRLGCYSLDASRPVPDHDGGRPNSLPWQLAALSESWANIGSDATPAGFMRDADGCVRLRGQVRRKHARGGGGKLPMLVFNLPQEYRPAYRHQIPVLAQGKMGVLEVRVDGDVVLLRGSGKALSLDGIVIAEERRA
jgi:hypothetical protein